MNRLKKLTMLITLIFAFYSSVFCFVVMAADTTGLQAAYDEVQTIITTQDNSPVGDPFYEVGSYQAFLDSITALGGLAGIQTVIDDTEAEQTTIDDLTDSINQAIAGLIEDDTYQTASSDFSTASAFDLSQYTSGSQNEFNDELDRIEAILDNPTAGETAIHALIFDIDDAYSLLIQKADMTNLSTAYIEALAIDLSPYTPNSVISYQEELARINEIINSDDTDQDEADAALVDLQAANSLLVLQADRSELQTLNTLATEAYYENGGLYTASSHAAFKTAVDAYGSYLYVNSVINDDNIDVAFVESLTQIIENALDLLVPLVDNSALISAYITYEEADLTGYTEASVNEYYSELERLYAIITGDEFDAEAADQVLTDLTVVTDLLVLLPDFTDLQELYDFTRIFREEDYSLSSYGALVVAKNNALDVINNPNATENMVEIAYTSLENAITEISPKAEKIFIKQGETIDINEYVTLGEATILRYFVTANNVISVNDSGVVEGLNFGESKVYIALSNGYYEILDVFVEAKLSTTVYILTFSIPVVSAGFGAAVIFVKKDSWIKIASSIKRIFKK